MSTPDEHDAPSRVSVAMPSFRRAGTFLTIAVTALCLLVGVGPEGLATFVGALALYLVNNVSAGDKAKAAKFLTNTLKPLLGCRTCQA
ncbi:hypothetical protein [Nocardiopsis alborubida]|uniref:Uncharacterized protein n=1 Tax=Nocardiopsis alborubida TaxID=146802 RepID=A0A7X6RS78_9ACTN|nr:hypothetical protein [Nocardiopsis alborubida]NKZ00017.1 hypothetical protein [Nocardiopsis alborubida]